MGMDYGGDYIVSTKYESTQATKGEVDGGKASKLEACERGDSLTFGSKEGVAAAWCFVLSKRIHNRGSTTGDEVNEGGDSELEASAGGDSQAFPQIKATTSLQICKDW